MVARSAASALNVPNTIDGLQAPCLCGMGITFIVGLQQVQVRAPLIEGQKCHADYIEVRSDLERPGLAEQTYMRCLQ